MKCPLFHTKRRLLILFRENIRQTPAGQQHHKLRHHIGSDTHVGNQCQIHSRKDRNSAHQEKDHQKDHRNTVFILLRSFFRQPALFCGRLQSSRHPAQGSIQGGEQCKYSTAEHEEQVQPGWKNLLRDKRQVLKCDRFDRKHAACHDTDQHVEYSNDTRGKHDNLWNRAGRLHDIITVLRNEFCASARKTQKCYTCEKVLRTVRHQVGYRRFQSIPAYFGQSEYNK